MPIDRAQRVLEIVTDATDQSLAALRRMLELEAALFCLPGVEADTVGEPRDGSDRCQRDETDDDGEPPLHLLGLVDLLAPSARGVGQRVIEVPRSEQDVLEDVFLVRCGRRSLVGRTGVQNRVDRPMPLISERLHSREVSGTVSPSEST